MVHTPSGKRTRLSLDLKKDTIPQDIKKIPQNIIEYRNISNALDILRYLCYDIRVLIRDFGIGEKRELW